MRNAAMISVMLLLAVSGVSAFDIYAFPGQEEISFTIERGFCSDFLFAVNNTGSGDAFITINGTHNSSHPVYVRFNENNTNAINITVPSSGTYVLEAKMCVPADYSMGEYFANMTYRNASEPCNNTSMTVLSRLNVLAVYTKSEIKDFKKEADNFRGTVNDLTGQIDRLNNRVESLRSSTGSDLNGIRIELNKCHSKITKKQNELDDINTEYREQKLKNSAYLKQIEEINAELLDAGDRALALNDTLNSICDERDELNETVNSLTAQIVGKENTQKAALKGVLAVMIIAVAIAGFHFYTRMEKKKSSLPHVYQFRNRGTGTFESISEKLKSVLPGKKKGLGF